MKRLIPLFALLVGCATGPTPAERQAANDRYWASLTNRCSQMGYHGDQRANCVMQLHQIEEQRRTALGAALIGSGAFNQRPTQPLPQPTPFYRNHPNYQCTTIGDTMSCTAR